VHLPLQTPKIQNERMRNYAQLLSPRALGEPTAVSNRVRSRLWKRENPLHGVFGSRQSSTRRVHYHRAARCRLWAYFLRCHDVKKVWAKPPTPPLLVAVDCSTARKVVSHLRRVKDMSIFISPPGTRYEPPINRTHWSFMSTYPHAAVTLWFVHQQSQPAPQPHTVNPPLPPSPASCLTRFWDPWTERSAKVGRHMKLSGTDQPPIHPCGEVRECLAPRSWTVVRTPCPSRRAARSSPTALPPPFVGAAACVVLLV
jgi:hypothetical protein